MRSEQTPRGINTENKIKPIENYYNVVRYIYVVWSYIFSALNAGAKRSHGYLPVMRLYYSPSIITCTKFRQQYVLSSVIIHILTSLYLPIDLRTTTDQ